MSQPKTTSQKPKPPSTAEKNLSRCRYLPRRIPSMSETATLILPTFDLRIASTIAVPALATLFWAGFFISFLELRLKHGDHGEGTENTEKLLCGVRGYGMQLRDSKVFLRGLRAFSVSSVLSFIPCSGQRVPDS